MTPKLATVAAICATVVACTTASAFAAATLITGAQIKDNTVAGVDIKNGSVAGADLKNGSVALADISKATRNALTSAGPAGATGAQGAQGERGFSAWDVIPSGKTVVGVFGDAAPNSEAGMSALSITLPATASAPLKHEDVNFAFSAISADTDPTCTGSAQVPTAPAGKVCVYVYSSSGVDADTAFGFAGIANRNGFRLRWNSTAIDQSMTGSWAYTAA